MRSTAFFPGSVRREGANVSTGGESVQHTEAISAKPWARSVRDGDTLPFCSSPALLVKCRPHNPMTGRNIATGAQIRPSETIGRLSSPKVRENPFCMPISICPPCPRNRLPRQWFEQVGAASRKGSRWCAAPTFVSIRGFDPSPSFRTTGSSSPVQTDHLPPMRGVFVGFERVLSAGWPQNRTTALPLSDVQGVDVTGRKSRLVERLE